MRIREVLASKSGPDSPPGEGLVTVTPQTTVRDLLSVLAEHNIGAAVVCDDDSPLDGIVSERDVVRALVSGPEALDSPVRDIMTTEVRTVTPNESVHDLMRLMTQYRIRHVPVLDGETLTGIVSIGDVVKSRIGELEFERDQLSSYVTNTQ